MKRSDKAVSLLQSESPSDPDISPGTETPKPPSKVVQLGTIEFPLPSLSVFAFALDGSPRRALWSIRTIPSKTHMARRQTEAAKLKAHIPKWTANRWKTTYRERILSELRAGNLETFHQWLHDYGPRALWLALSEPEVLALLEGWWIDGAVLKDVATQEKLAVTLRIVSEQKLTRDKKYLSEESKGRKKKSDADAKDRYNTQASAHLADLKSQFSTEIEKLPRSVKRDPRERQKTEEIIKNRLLAQTTERKAGPWQHAVKDFRKWFDVLKKKKW